MQALTLVGNKTFGAMARGQGPGCSWQQGLGHTAWLQEGSGYHSGLSTLWPSCCRFHWQSRACEPHNFQASAANTIPGLVAPQEQLLHQPSAGHQAALP